VGAVPNQVTVVGAGLAGLVAARRLRDRGIDVVVLEATDRVGGRLATVAVAGARADVGAQFFTVRSPAFAALVETWPKYEWCRGFGDRPDGFPRYAVTDGMARLAEWLAEGLDIRFGVAVEDAPAAPTIVTPPRPDMDYERCIALVAVVDRPPAGLPPPGAVQLTDGPFTWVADNQVKGISPVPALTLHANPELSVRFWDDPDRLFDEARPWLGRAQIVATHITKWRHSKPVNPLEEPCVILRPGVVLAGDFCNGAKVEGAALAGLAAADAIFEQLA
jgi:renalase